MEERIRQLQQWIKESRKTVFLGGAGVSTASGIPDFRSAHGLYMEKKMGVSYEEMLSHEYFVNNPLEFYDFMRKVMLYPQAKPNPAHYALAKLETAGYLQRVITQNIDGLHQLAGSQAVIELHGNENRYYCLSCGKTFDMSIVLENTGIPRCSCGGMVRPDVVLYQESLNEKDLLRAIADVQEAQLLLVAGTSLVVYPVAGLVTYLNPKSKLVILNRDPTPYDGRAAMIFREDLTEVLEKTVAAF
jgi:NAD-dependent deacetylase